MTISCPECSDEFDSTHSLKIHWGVKHDGECPIEYEPGEHPTDGFEHDDEFIERMRDREFTWNDEISEGVKRAHERTDSIRDAVREGVKDREFTDEQRKRMGQNTPSGEDHWNWKGGDYVSRNEDWRRLAESVRERDNHRCQFCGLPAHVQPALHVHHIVRRRDGGPDEKGNLLSLCVRCHARAELLDLGVPSSKGRPQDESESRISSSG